MDYIPLDLNADPVSRFISIAMPFIFVFLGLGFVAGVALLLKWKNSFGWFLIVAGAICAAILIPTALSEPAPTSIAALTARRHQAPEIQREIQKAYGLETTRAQVQSLNYPNAKPTKSFEIFGSFKDRKQVEGTQFEQRTIYLVWADGKFGLSQSSDGESFTPLESRS